MNITGKYLKAWKIEDKGNFKIVDLGDSDKKQDGSYDNFTWYRCLFVSKAAQFQINEKDTIEIKSGKITKAIDYFKEDQKDAYTELFENRPEILEELGDYLSSIEMTYLAEKPGDGSSYYRTAEYNSISDGSGIPVILINIEGNWYIDSL